MQSRSLTAVAAISFAVVAAGCGSDTEDGIYTLPGSEAGEYPTAYIDTIVADPPGDDLAEDGGEHLVIANNAEIRIDMGGWWIDVGGTRLPLGIGRQIDVAATLAVHPGPGETSDDAVFVGLDRAVLDDDGGRAVLRDAAGSEVARFAYGDARN